MNLAKLSSLGLATIVSLSVVACGSSNDGSSVYGNGSIAGGSNDSSSGNSSGSSGAFGTPTGSSSSTSGAGFAACATSTASATPKPVYLVFAYDQSGSMAEDGKWDAANAAMKGFFTSTGATGLNASLTFFPKYDAYPQFCDLTEYTIPDVSMTSLPSATFGSAIDATAPQPGQGGTPTLAAITGAMGYAQILRQTTAKNANVAVVMVTDGVPEVCSDAGNVGPASAVAAANASTVPTYVVGVGSDLSNLNEIAAAGGTSQAFVVSVGNPAQTQTDLTNAINTIKMSALSCEYAIPAAPSGETFDPTKVNVQYTPSGGAAQTLGYNPTCAGGLGWQYDNAQNPTQVLACSGACATIKATPGDVAIVFGCATQDTPVK